MSLIKANAVQIGQSPTATQNFTLAVPSSPDGTIKLARGNSGATTQDVMNVSNAGVVSFPQGLGNISSGTAIATGSTTARSLANRFADVVNAKDFGLSTSNTAAQNLAALKAAVTASPIGGTILIPADSTFYTIDTTGGLSNAIVINKRLTFVFDGDVKSNFGAIQSNPPCIFNVTADNVTFTGTGKIIGDGTIDDTNSGTDSTMPALVRVTGDAFTANGITIDTPCKIGIHLLNSSYSNIVNCKFTGGPSTYTIGNTAYFAIRLYQTTEVNISNNRFYPNATNGMYVNCIFSNADKYTIISNNTCIKPYEKLCYINGDYNLITGNVVVGNTGTIPGTSQGGTITSVYRVNGSYNKISNNYSYYCLAGATVMDGIFNEVSGNTFEACGQLGIVAFPNSTYTGTFNGTLISNNRISGAAITGIVLTNGISVNLNYATSKNIQIINNSISSFADTASEGMIYLSNTSPYSLTDCKVSGNFMNGGTIGVNGIYISRVTDSLISDNFIENCSGFAMLEIAGAYNNWLNNKCDSIGTIGISGINSTSFCQGNQYTRAALVGTATTANAITTTITHGGVAPNARIFLQTANDAAGTLIIAKGWPTTGISGNNFVITMANGTASGTTTAQFHYNIIQ